jgi:hypothetical protein
VYKETSVKNKALCKLAVALGVTLVVSALLIGLPMLTGAQGPIGNTFTYQGRLLKSSFYVNGVTCDFQFGLYDALTGGTQIGNTQAVPGVAVRDGYFTVELNGANQFGPDAFSGDRRYLQIAVRCGSDTAYTTMNERVPLNPAPYALYAQNAASVTSIPWDNVTDKPPGFADNVDNVVTYTNGFGLDLQVFTYTQGAAVSEYGLFSLVTGTVLNAIGDTWQRRVVESCADPEAIQVINPNGTVVCGTTSQTYTAGEGLILTGNKFAIDGSVVQRRVTENCGSYGSQLAIRKINQDGTVQCEQIPQGDITAVIAGDGLTGGGTSGNVMLAVAGYGITANMLADGAVDSGKIASRAITTTKIAGGVINTTHIKDRTILFADLAPCSGGPIPAWDDTIKAWKCTDQGTISANAGDGIEIVNGIISARIGDGLKFASGQIAADFPPKATPIPNNGSPGTANTVARDDHNHDDRYPQKDTEPAPKDLQPGSSYASGFKIGKILGKGLDLVTNPSTGQILRYNGSQWAPADYGFDLSVCVRASDWDNEGQGGASAVCDSTCPGTLVGGGCECSGDNDLGDTWLRTASKWGCQCSGSARAYAICATVTKR